MNSRLGLTLEEIIGADISNNEEIFAVVTGVAFTEEGVEFIVEVLPKQTEDPKVVQFPSINMPRLDNIPTEV